MDTKDAQQAFTALSQSTRLAVFRHLMAFSPQAIAAGELARRLNVPQNTLSTHLAALVRAGLIDAERQGRSILYRSNAMQLQNLIGYLVDDCCLDQRKLNTAQEMEMSNRMYNVLFLCTGNSARSILAESILNQDGKGMFRAYSAGSMPAGKVNPFSLKVLKSFGYSVDGARSKNWDEFSGPHAPDMDFIITVCDNAAGEVCPVWPGQPMTAHWGIEDPAAVEGTNIEKEAAFVQAFKYMKNRISLLTALPIDKLDKMSLKQNLKSIGQINGSTDLTRQTN